MTLSKINGQAGWIHTWTNSGLDKFLPVDPEVLDLEVFANENILQS